MIEHFFITLRRHDLVNIHGDKKQRWPQTKVYATDQKVDGHTAKNSDMQHWERQQTEKSHNTVGGWKHCAAEGQCALGGAQATLVL